MTTLKNQLRATLYLASRDAYVKGAFVLPVLMLVPSLILHAWDGGRGYVTITFEHALSGLLDAAVVFGTAFAVSGLLQHGWDHHGWRASVVAEGGRAGFVASHVILAGVLACALTLWACLLGLAVAAVPGIAFDGTPPSELAALALVHLLVGWAFAVICLVFSTGGRGLGWTIVVTYLITRGALGSTLKWALFLITGFARVGVTEAFLDPLLLRGLVESFAITDPVRFFALPLVYLALASILFYLRVTRADV